MRRDDPRYASNSKPLVITDRIANALRLTAVDGKAAQLGLSIGMSLTDARARTDVLDVAVAAHAHDDGLLERLADWCHRYTPLVALDGPHGLVLDVTGCDHLFGGLIAMRKDVMARCMRAGLTTRAAIAANPSAARLLARFSQGGVFDDKQAQEALPRLPVAALEIDAATQTGLKRAGLQSIGNVLAIPRAALTARFGPELVTRLDRLQHRATHPISPRRLVPIVMSERRLAEPVSAMELVEAVLLELSMVFFDLLAQENQGGLLIEAAFFRVDGLVRRIAIETGRPLSEPAIFMRLLRERLSTLSEPLDAGFGFDMITLSALRAERVTHSQISLDQSQESTACIGALIDRLSIRMGQPRVLRMTPQDSHIPERAFAVYPAIRAAPKDQSFAVKPSAGEPPSWPIRLFQPPHAIETTAEMPDGPPAQFRWRRVVHKVRLAEGPERIAPEWWRNLSADTPDHPRDYYRIEDENGRRFWIFREGLYEDMPAPRWFLHGLFA